MSNDGANGSVVERIVGIGFEEWKLQDTSGKGDVVSLWTVISVHGRRRHAPLSPVNRFTDFGKVEPPVGEVRRFFRIRITVAGNLNVRVTSKFHGTADARIERVELSQSILPGFWFQPLGRSQLV